MSLDALFPILEEWEERYGSITRGMRESKKAVRGSNPPPSAFFSFDGGAYRIVQAVVDSLEKTEIISGRAAVAVDRKEAAHSLRYRATLDDAQSFESDVVVLATPAQDAGTLVGSFAPSLGRLLEGMRSSPTGSVSMAFRREDVTHPLDGSGFLAPRSEAGLVAGCTWTSSKWPGRSPGDYVLLRAFLGSAKGRSFLEHSDEDLIAAATETLRPLLGIRGAPERAWVHRWAEGMPQYKVDHTEWLDGVERELAGHQGLFLCGASYRGIGVPDCVRQGRDTAEQHPLIRAAERRTNLHATPECLTAGMCRTEWSIVEAERRSADGVRHSRKPERTLKPYYRGHTRRTRPQPGSGGRTCGEVPCGGGQDTAPGDDPACREPAGRTPEPWRRRRMARLRRHEALASVHSGRCRAYRCR